MRRVSTAVSRAKLSEDAKNYVAGYTRVCLALSFAADFGRSARPKGVSFENDCFFALLRTNWIYDLILKLRIEYMTIFYN